MGRGIFISYRRGADNSEASMIHNSLRDHFGADNVFMDVDNFPLGRDFLAYLREKIRASRICLVVIGEGWNARASELHKPDDFVRVELEEALNQPKLRMIPVFFNSGTMPDPADLPESLRPMAFRNGLSVPHEHSSLVISGRLIPALEEMLEAATANEPTLEEALSHVDDADTSLPQVTVVPSIIPNPQKARQQQFAEAAVSMPAPEVIARKPIGGGSRMAIIGASLMAATVGAIGGFTLADLSAPVPESYTAMTADLNVGISPAGFGDEVNVIKTAGEITDIRVSPNGMWVAASTSSGAINIQNLLTTEAAFAAFEDYPPIASVDFAPQGTMIAFASNRTVEIWDMNDDMPTAEARAHSDRITDVSYSPDGRFVVSAGDGGELIILNSANGAVIARLTGHEDAINAVAVDKESALIASASDDESIRIWDIVDHVVLGKLAVPGGASKVIFSPASQHVIYGTRDGRVGVWDPFTGGQIELPLRTSGAIAHIASDSFGRRLVISDTSGKTQLFDVGSFEMLDEFSQGQVFDLSQDGRYLVVVSGDVGRIIDMKE